MTDLPETHDAHAAITTWLSATTDSAALADAAEAHDRMRRLWAAELSATLDLT